MTEAGGVEPLLFDDLVYALAHDVVVGYVEEAFARRAELEPAPVQGELLLTDVLLPEEKAAVRKQFADGKACTHCGGAHSRACPRVRRMTFHPNGALSEVEFWPDRAWSDDSIIWPEDVQDTDTVE